MTRDAWLLFAARAVRMSGYGALGVILVLYLTSAGLDAGQVGILLTLTLVGDTLISLWLTTHADRIGRRRTLVVGALLMAAAGVVFAAGPAFAGSGLFLVLLVAATIGVLSPSGAEVGPFLPIEQASLTEVTPSDRRTSIYAWYNLTGSVATAVGALIAGLVVGALLGAGWSDLDAYRLVLLSYAIRGLVLIPIVRAVSPAVEVPPVDTSIGRTLGLHRSRGVVARLASLFAPRRRDDDFLERGLLVVPGLRSRRGTRLLFLGQRHRRSQHRDGANPDGDHAVIRGQPPPPARLEII